MNFMKTLYFAAVGLAFAWLAVSALVLVVVVLWPRRKR